MYFYNPLAILIMDMYKSIPGLFLVLMIALLPMFAIKLIGPAVYLYTGMSINALEDDAISDGGNTLAALICFGPWYLSYLLALYASYTDNDSLKEKGKELLPSLLLLSPLIAAQIHSSLINLRSVDFLWNFLSMASSLGIVGFTASNLNSSSDRKHPARMLLNRYILAVYMSVSLVSRLMLDASVSSFAQFQSLLISFLSISFLVFDFSEAKRIIPVPYIPGIEIKPGRSGNV